MKILFVVQEIYHEHLGIMLLSSVLKQRGHTVAVAEASLPRLRTALRTCKYEMVAFSTPSVFFDAYVSLARELKKEFSFFSVFGGAHPTFQPEILEDPSIDCVCRGEGEYALAELADKLACGESPAGIANLWIKWDGKIFRHEPRPLIEDLDGLPFVDRELFPHGETCTKGKMHVMTGRGCPFDCAYCSHPALVKIYGPCAKRIRRRSVANVIEEIRQARARYDVRFVMFEDDLFSLDLKWLELFARQYSSEIHLPFFCYVRATGVSAGMVKLLKEAGCIAMSMGIETASERLRNEVLKRAMSQGEILNAARIIKSAGIRLEGLNIVGIPTGSPKDDIATIDLNRQMRVDYASAKLLMPYPGTEISAFASERGLLKNGFSLGHSSIRFKDLQEQRMTENLCALFSLAVACPFVRFSLPLLIRWPLGPLYRFLHRLWEGYAAFFILYPTTWRGFGWGLYKYLCIMFSPGASRGARAVPALER